MNTAIRFLTSIVLLSNWSCGSNTKPDGKAHLVYPREDGLKRFIEEHLLELEDTVNLIFANNRGCNCGSAGFEVIDSMLSTMGNHQTIWLLHDEDSLFSNGIQANGDKVLYIDELHIPEYGIATITPQLFTVTGKRVLNYKKVPH